MMADSRAVAVPVNILPLLDPQNDATPAFRESPVITNSTSTGTSTTVVTTTSTATQTTVPNETTYVIPLATESSPNLCENITDHTHDYDASKTEEMAALVVPSPLALPSISMVHLNMNYTYNSVDSKSDTSSSMLPMCRICHQPDDPTDSDELISPCRCAGTLQFIHGKCLTKWLEVMTKKSRKPPKCELCLYQYHRHKKFKFHHWRFPRISRRDRILHFIFIINLLIMITCAVATVMCFLSDKGQISHFPRNKVNLTTEEIITLTCGVLFFVSFFIAMSVQIKAKHTVYQLFVKFFTQNMEWEIDEYDKSKDSLYKGTNTMQPVYV